MVTFSLEGKLALVVGVVAALTVAVTAILFLSLDNAWVAIILALTLSVTVAVIIAKTAATPMRNLILALRDGVAGLKDGDFSTSIARRRNDELGKLVGVYNELGDVLRRERQSLFQRELLLDTVIQTTPLALVLVNPSDRVVYNNTSARELFRDGKPLNGLNFGAVLEKSDEGFSRAVSSGRDGLFTINEDDEPHTYHLSLRHFELNAQPHQLYLFKQLTHELSRQEVATWKKVIRLISHELNNSLAPISSLAHSGGIILKTPNQEKLADIFATIEERSLHLKTFIEGYARFARLPAPQLQSVNITGFVDMLNHTVNFKWDDEKDYGEMQADQAQLEQVFINLFKNAHESGSPGADVELVITSAGSQVRFEVHDRGTGMSEQVMKNALLPFYSTKQTGTGLGLPLCREIVEAHEGRLSIANREGGGMTVSVTLPHAKTSPVQL